MRETTIGLIGLTLSLICCGPPEEPALIEEQPAGGAYVQLVGRLGDLRRLATLPALGERTALWSSYDRKSRYDEKTGRYLDWGANADGTGIIREEGGREVLAEMDGPGCIWRIWSASPGEGHVRIYLDGASEPAVDLPFSGYFDRRNEPFTRPSLVHTVALGKNNYTPITYQRSCKIVADRGWGQFYQFTYSTFPAGTSVPTFKRELSSAEATALDRADALLASVGPRAPAADDLIARGDTALSARGGSETVVLEGAGAITALRVRVRPEAGEGAAAPLSGLTVEMRWDGEPSPSVWSPLGDFFGTAPGLSPYRSLPAGVGADGWLYASWFMPFARSAEVRFVNHGDGARALSYEIVHQPLPGDLSGLGRFHAKWHEAGAAPIEPGRELDWPLLHTAGRGRLVGVALHVWNPEGGWWGEGDEKIFVDDERFPSSFGTGSEDYFGYAWCDPTLFQHAYHNQTHNDGKNKGHISVNRWHIADQVPFQRRFEGVIEKYSSRTSYASTVYWYLEPGGEDPYGPPSEAE